MALAIMIKCLNTAFDPDLKEEGLTSTTGIYKSIINLGEKKTTT